MNAATDEGMRKAAILMVLLGEEAASRVMQNLNEPEVIAIGREVARLGEITPEQSELILTEYHDRILAHRDRDEGGPDAARRMVGRSVQPSRLDAAIDSLSPDRPQPLPALSEAQLQKDPFAPLARVREKDLVRTLETEHPQTAALVLMNLDPQRAATVLGGLSEGAQAGITARMSRLAGVSEEVTRDLSRALASSFEGAPAASEAEERDPAEATAEVLKRLDRTRTRSILKALETQDPETAERLRSRVYTFEMLMLIDDRGVQELLKGQDQRALALAVKGATPEVGEKFFKNMSERASQMVKDEIEYLGTVKLKDVEAAQKALLDKAMALEEQGVISFGSEAA